MSNGEEDEVEKQVFEFFKKNKDPDLIEALYQPAIIDSSNESIQKVAGNMSLPLLICDDPDAHIKNVPNQLNFILPLTIKNSNDSYIVNLKNDLNMYRKTYEKYAKQVNELIDKTKNSVKKFYKPLKKLRKRIKNYSENYEKSIKELSTPLIHKRDGLNQIDFSKYPNDKQKKFLNDKNEIIQEINDFIDEAHNFCKIYEKLNKNTLEEVEKFVEQFINLIKPSKELSEFLTELFEIFEKSSYLFNDLTNKEKIASALQKIKKPINQFKKRAETIINLLKPVEDFDKNKKLDDLKKFINQTKDSMENLKKKSKIISTKVEKIREKYGEEKVNLRSMKIEPPNEINIVECSKELEKEQKVINQKAKENLDEMVNDVTVLLNQSRLDLLFILDITNSMDLYLDQAKSGILDMMRTIEKECPGIEICLGFIGYRDFNDLDFGEEYTNLQFTTDYEKIRNSIKNIVSEGGGDTPEDLCGAFDLAKNKDWEGKAKFAVLVTDSPCHGNQYHNLKDDNYPEGDRLGRKIEDYIKFFAEKEISLFCLKINESTDKMFKIFQTIYNKNKPEQTKASFVYQRGNQLFEFVTKNAVKTFQSREKLEIK